VSQVWSAARPLCGAVRRSARRRLLRSHPYVGSSKGLSVLYHASCTHFISIVPTFSCSISVWRTARASRRSACCAIERRRPGSSSRQGIRPRVRAPRTRCGRHGVRVQGPGRQRAAERRPCCRTRRAVHQPARGRAPERAGMGDSVRGGGGAASGEQARTVRTCACGCSGGSGRLTGRWGRSRVARRAPRRRSARAARRRGCGRGGRARRTGGRRSRESSGSGARSRDGR